MENLNLIDAWSLWMSGNSLGSYLLWGVPILWWGRLGKIVSLISAAAIIADIIGPEKLRIFGKSLSGQFELRQAWKTITNGIKWFKVMWQDLLSPIGSEVEKEARIEAGKYGADNLNYVMILIIVISGVLLLGNNYQWWIIIGGSIFAFFVGVYTFGPFLTVIFILFSMVFLAFIDTIIIEPVAWLLERPDLDKLIKVMSFTLLILGFHFDLLAS